MTKKKTIKDAWAMGLISKTTGVKPASPIATRAHVRPLIEFARDNHFIVTPVGYGYSVERFSKFGCCPCAPERKGCPCEEALNEIILLGKCKCQLFWRDYETYLAEKFKEE